MVRDIAIATAVGIVAGGVTACVKLHLGIPGHKAVLWMPLVIASRLLSGCRIGATVGSLSTAGAAYACGGNLAGDMTALPLIVVAGAVLDYFANMTRHHCSIWRILPIIAGGAMIANIICLAKRLSLPLLAGSHVLSGYSEPIYRVLSYATCGLAAGVAGVVLYALASKCRRRINSDKNDLPDTI
jgi:hypothetical protein